MKDSKDSKKLKTNTFFNYKNGINFPVYIQVNSMQLNQRLEQFLETQKFHIVSNDNKELQNNQNAKILTLEIANKKVVKQIDDSFMQDLYGSESVIPQNGFQVYRLKHVGMIVYSLSAKAWTLGCKEDFGVNQNNLVEYKILINRVLSWALLSQGIIGFWGSCVEQGIVVLKPYEANGEAVFIDLFNKTFLTKNGPISFSSNFKIIKLSNSSYIQKKKNKRHKMNFSELAAFLSNSCTFFDYSSHNTAISQIIYKLSSISQGIIIPAQNFQHQIEY